VGNGVEKKVVPFQGYNVVFREIRVIVDSKESSD
jgi:hypothetical protein